MERNIETIDESTQKTIMSDKQYCVRLYKAGPNRNPSLAEAERIHAEHRRDLLQLMAEGKLLAHGPVVDNPELKALSIFSTTDMEEVKRLSDEDPAVKSGRVVYEIYICQP